MKTLISTILFLLFFVVGQAQTISNQVSSYDSTVDSLITFSNSHSQQITPAIVGNSYTNLSAIILNLYDSTLKAIPYNLVYSVGHDANSGNTVTIPALINRTILMVYVGNVPVFPISFTASTGTFDFTAINGVYSTTLNILYK